MNNNNNLTIAALAKHASPEVSSRYKFLPTTDIIQALLDKGFEVVGSNQWHTKNPALREFAKHAVRLRPPKTALYTLGQLIPEVTITNAHQSGALTGHAGAFVCFCTNQCIKPISHTVNEAYFRHTQKITMDDVIEGIFTVVGRSNEWVKQLADWNKIPITPDDAEHFAEQALLLRWPQGNSPVTPLKALQPRYVQETQQTLGAVYNRLHNLAQHGLPRVGKGRVARALRNDSFIKFNGGLVQIAESLVLQ